MSLKKAPYVAFLAALTMLGSSVTFMSAASAETLQEALISAYNKNPRLMAERARVREIDENYVQAQAQGRLTSSLSGSVGANVNRAPGFSLFGPSQIETNTFYPRTLQLQVIQPLYQGGRVRALKQQAKAGIMAARENLRNTEQGIFNAAATAYVDVLRDEEAARIRRNNVVVLTRQLTAAKDRFEVGEGTRTDIAQSQSRLAAAEIGLAQADAQLEISRAAYKQVVGHPPVNLQRAPRFILPETLGQAQMIARENNPQLMAARFNEKAAEANIVVAKSASRPTISLNGTASGARGQSFGISRSENATIAAQISVPIFTGGLNRSSMRSASEARTRSKFETRDAENIVDQNVAQLWAQLDSARRTLRASEQQVAAAEVAFEGVVLEQQVGTRTTLDVLDAEQEVLVAKLTVINAERALNVATYQLLSVLGTFDAQALQLPVDYYDPAKNFDDVRNITIVEQARRYMPESIAQPIGALTEKVGTDLIELYDMGFANPISSIQETPDRVKIYKDGVKTSKNVMSTPSNDVMTYEGQAGAQSQALDVTSETNKEGLAVKIGRDFKNLGRALIGKSTEESQP